MVVGQSGGEAVASSLVGAGDAKGSIVVRMGGFRNAKGRAQVALFKEKNDYPGRGALKVARANIEGKGKTARLVFRGLDPGQYALSVIHDENANGKLDTNFLGMPKEGVGASNNAKGRFGPPSYEDAKFVVAGGAVTQRIALTYL